MSENYESYIPVERDGSRGDRRSAIYFMIRGLLSSRVESGMSDDDGPSEEDVNVYLSYLLCDFLNPAYHERANQYVAPHDTSVFEQVRNTTDTRLKYTVYKTNADHILMMTGLFQNTEGHSPHALAEPLRIDEDTHWGRGKAYYDFAFTYSRSLFGRTSGIANVLSKLSSRFERYVRLLTYMRIDYLNLVDRLSVGDVYHLQRELYAGDVTTLRNDFLDAYRAWHEDPTAKHRALVERTAARLHEADPSFRFEFPEN